jgi:ketosteroid isomerase-like protein
LSVVVPIGSSTLSPEGKTVTTSFAIFCKVQDGNITYMQFMEDTFATAASFPSGRVLEVPE